MTHCRFRFFHSCSVGAYLREKKYRVQFASADRFLVVLYISLLLLGKLRVPIVY